MKHKNTYRALVGRNIWTLTTFENKAQTSVILTDVTLSEVRIFCWHTTGREPNVIQACAFFVTLQSTNNSTFLTTTKERSLRNIIFQAVILRNAVFKEFKVLSIKILTYLSPHAYYDRQLLCTTKKSNLHRLPHHHKRRLQIHFPFQSHQITLTHTLISFSKKFPFFEMLPDVRNVPS